MYTALINNNAVHVETQSTTGSEISGDGIVVIGSDPQNVVIEGTFTVGEFTVEAIRFRVSSIQHSSEKSRPSSFVICQDVEAPFEGGWQTIVQKQIHLILLKI